MTHHPSQTESGSGAPIDVGRQLFVDDFLIESTSLVRTFHQPEYFPGNPVLRPDRPWESAGTGPFAAPFSDGAWYDPRDRLFKTWYYAGYQGGLTCYATSPDGIRWDKPDLDVEPAEPARTAHDSPSNIVLRHGRDSCTVWLDPEPRDPGEQFKMALTEHDGGPLVFFRSADGLHWIRVATGARCGDRSTFFYNPFRRRWVFSLRTYDGGRRRLYWETADFFSACDADAVRREAVPWVGADGDDPPRDDLRVRPELYNLDCVAYESLMLGLFSIWRGDYRQPAEPASAEARALLDAGRPKQNSVCVGFSRDGFRWARPDRRPFLPVSERRGDWNWGNVQSVAPCCLVVDDELWFYVSGRAGKACPGCTLADAAGSTGLAKLRRDGFASMDAGDAPGTLTTRPLRFRGRHLFVNLDAPDGELRVEALDAGGSPIPPYDHAHARAVRGNGTRHAVSWDGAPDLAPLANRPVRFRFHLKRGRLYAFWVTPDPAGASFGYVAGGGPGFAGPLDIPAEAQTEGEARRATDPRTPRGP